MRHRYSLRGMRIKRIISMTIILILIATSIHVFTNGPNPVISASAQQVSWSLKLQITEPQGSGNLVTLGGSPNASDGQDDHDIPEPPAPPQLPYLRAWFATSLSVPFNRLLNESKHIPAQRLQWNLSILWAPSPGNNSSTTIRISWDPTQAAKSTFNSFQLYEGNITVANLLTQTSYSFLSNGTLHRFQIIGQRTSTNDTSGQNNTTNDTQGQTNIPMFPILLGISVLIIVIIIVLVFYKQKK